jgi:hypothetical protein
VIFVEQARCVQLDEEIVVVVDDGSRSRAQSWGLVSKPIRWRSARAVSGRSFQRGKSSAVRGRSSARISRSVETSVGRNP